MSEKDPPILWAHTQVKNLGPCLSPPCAFSLPRDCIFPFLFKPSASRGPGHHHLVWPTAEDPPSAPGLTPCCPVHHTAGLILVTLSLQTHRGPPQPMADGSRLADSAACSKQGTASLLWTRIWGPWEEKHGQGPFSWRACHLGRQTLMPQSGDPNLCFLCITYKSMLLM